MFRVLLVHKNGKTLEKDFPWKEYGFAHIRTTADPQHGLNLLKSEPVDALFVSDRLPGMSLPEFLQAAVQSNPSVKSVLLTDGEDFAKAWEVLRHGAVDYCMDPDSPEEVRAVLSGLAGRIVEGWTVEGNRLLLGVLCSADACRRLLSSLTEQEGKNLHLFAIRSPILPEILSRIPGFAARTVFLSSDRVLFLSLSAPDREVLSVVEAYQTQGLFLYDTSPMKVTALQNVLNQFYKELSDFGQRQTGFLQMSYLGEGVPEHFHTLVFYVDNNYFKDLSLQSLSREFGINYSYLSQVFKKITHKSFSEYLTAVRLGHACQMLLGTQKKVSAIAEQVGYNDYHYFCNIFKKHFDMTPSQYRSLHGRRDG